MQVDEAAQKLQQNEQQVEQLHTQKKNFQSQLAEIENALEAISSTDTTYQLIGNIMVKQDVDTVKQGLDEKKETLQVRISTLEKQELKLKEKTKEYQESILNTKEK